MVAVRFWLAAIAVALFSTATSAGGSGPWVRPEIPEPPLSATFTPYDLAGDSADDIESASRVAETEFEEAAGGDWQAADIHFAAPLAFTDARDSTPCEFSFIDVTALDGLDDADDAAVSAVNFLDLTSLDGYPDDAGRSQSARGNGGEEATQPTLWFLLRGANEAEAGVGLEGEAFTFQLPSVHLADSERLGGEFATFGEVDRMATQELLPRRLLLGGYSLLWIDGVAISTDRVSKTPAKARQDVVDTSGDVLFHGRTTGLEFYW